MPNENEPRLTPGYKPRKEPKVLIRIIKKKKKITRRGAAQTSGETAAMTSSELEIPGELQTDPAALMASLQLMPSPVPDPEIKYTKVGFSLQLCAEPLVSKRSLG